MRTYLMPALWAAALLLPTLAPLDAFRGGDVRGGDFHGDQPHQNWGGARDWQHGDVNGLPHDDLHHDDWNQQYQRYQQDRRAYDAGLDQGYWNSGGGGTSYVVPEDSLDDVEQYANPNSSLQQNQQYNQQQANPLQDLQYQPQ